MNHNPNDTRVYFPEDLGLVGESNFDFVLTKRDLSSTDHVPYTTAITTHYTLE